MWSYTTSFNNLSTNSNLPISAVPIFLEIGAPLVTLFEHDADRPLRGGLKSYDAFAGRARSEATRVSNCTGKWSSYCAA